MEFLNNIWHVIAPYLAGISIGGIFTAVVYGCLKGAFAKTVNKINIDKIVENATNKAVEKVKDVSFKHSIQPLVNSELEKISEKANSYISFEISKVESRYINIVEILTKLAAYFDNSAFISDDTKKELKNALDHAKQESGYTESVVASEIIEEKQEKVKEEKKSSKTER